jgi:aryl-alcohol dehydrogenase-like predicted oxidoreductase
METAVLGKTGLQVSRLGAGLAEIGTLDGPSTASRVLNAALDGGINFLDTSPSYGRSEEWIGRSIAHRRREYALATKCGCDMDGHQGEQWTAKMVLDSIDRSLKCMQTNYLDLVQLRSCSVEVLERGEVIQALLGARRAGKTRYIGYSGNLKGARWVIDSGLFDTVQITLNLVDQWACWDVLPKAKAADMGVIAKRPIANAAWGAPASLDPVREGYRQKAQAMRDMGPIPQSPEDPILLALGFVLAHPEIDTAIVGTASPAHMKANIALVENELPIPIEVVRELHCRFDELERRRVRGTE